MTDEPTRAVKEFREHFAAHIRVREELHEISYVDDTEYGDDTRFRPDYARRAMLALDDLFRANVEALLRDDPPTDAPVWDKVETIGATIPASEWEKVSRGARDEMFRTLLQRVLSDVDAYENSGLSDRLIADIRRSLGKKRETGDAGEVTPPGLFHIFDDGVRAAQSGVSDGANPWGNGHGTRESRAWHAGYYSVPRDANDDVVLAAKPTRVRAATITVQPDDASA